MRRAGAEPGGREPAGGAHRDERCAKDGVGGAQPDVRSGAPPQSWARRIVLTQDARGAALSSAGDGAASLALGAWRLNGDCLGLSAGLSRPGSRLAAR